MSKCPPPISCENIIIVKMKMLVVTFDGDNNDDYNCGDNQMGFSVFLPVETTMSLKRKMVYCFGDDYIGDDGGDNGDDDEGNGDDLDYEDDTSVDNRDYENVNDLFVYFLSHGPVSWCIRSHHKARDRG